MNQFKESLKSSTVTCAHEMRKRILGGYRRCAVPHSTPLQAPKVLKGSEVLWVKSDTTSSVVPIGTGGVVHVGRMSESGQVIRSGDSTGTGSVAPAGGMSESGQVVIWPRDWTGTGSGAQSFKGSGTLNSAPGG